MSTLSTEYSKEKYKALVYADKEADDYVLIDWSLSNICNYSCSYCPDKLHNWSYTWHESEIVTRFIDTVICHYRKIWKKCIFQFTWWEVSLWPDLINVLKFIKNKGAYTSIISNASRSLDWWKQASDLLDTAIFTYHGEFVNEKDFIKKSCYLWQKLDLYVCITMDPRFFSIRKKSVDILKKYAQRWNFSVFVKPLFIDFSSTLYQYTDEQKEYINLASYMTDTYKKHNHVPTRKMVKDFWNTYWKMEFNKSGTILHSENSWTGWKCNIWINLLTIKFNGDIYRGQCGEWWKIGNLYDTSFRLPTSQIICTKKTCKCLSDIMVPKYFA